MSIDKDSGEDPLSGPHNTSEEQRKLEAAGWERVERQGKLLWRNPQSGHLYTQGSAVKCSRAISFSEQSKGDS